jgi:SAM-dependent methyltransferase
MGNDGFWDLESRAQGYARRTELYPPEAAFIDEFAPLMARWKMLDLGIGGGRSTIHFAPLVEAYVGTDFSPTMVEACVSRLAGSAVMKNVSALQVADVRDLPESWLGQFDFVFFSFNGIDEVGHEDRLLALRQIRRVLKDDGVFFFSSHNLNSVDRLFAFERRRRPDRVARSAFRWVMLRSVNPRLRTLRTLRSWPLLHDYHFDYSKTTYYVHPEEQAKQLDRAGFSHPRVFVGATEYDRRTLDETPTDTWLYYLCRAV